jgi:phytanoyl-CoA hydroxylase
MPLTPQELTQFEDNGYVAIKNYLDKATVVDLNAEIVSMISSVHIGNHPKIKFTTGNDKDGHISDKYFLDSSDKIHYFFEPEAINDHDHKLNRPLPLAINKIGHGLHFLNDKFNAVTVNDDVASICRQLGFKDAMAVQSMCVIKQPHIGAAVPPHNDAEFLYTNPSTCVGFWFALQDCTLENGCLEVIPGSQKNKLKKRFVKDLKKGFGTRFAELDNLDQEYKPTDEDLKLQDFYNDDANYEKVVIPAGSLVLIDGKVIHKSAKNLSDHTRNAYTFHVVDGTAVYDEYNWLQIPPSKPAGTANFTRLYKNYE